MTALRTAPLLAPLLRRALPGLAVLDLALAEGGLYPWLAEALPGAGDPARLPEAERTLLAGFRRGLADGPPTDLGRGPEDTPLAGFARSPWDAPLAGFDPPRDAALLAGAPEAWGGAAHRLVVPGGGSPSAFGAGPWLEAGMMVLAPAAAPPLAGRVMLVLGLGGVVERLDLMLPEGRLDALLPLLDAAAEAMAAKGGGAAAGWERGVRAVSPRLAALTLFAPAGAAPPAVLEAGQLLLDLAEAPRRLRLLLGVLPPGPHRLRLQLAGLRAPPAFLVDGLRQAPAACVAEPDGGMRLEAVLRPGGDLPTVIGLGDTSAAGAGMRVLRAEIGPA